SAIDVISILKKQREPVEDIKISIEADREKDKVPALFTKIQVHYKIFGNVNEEKAKRALDLSFGTYCSVSKSLGPVTEVTYSFEIIPGKAE
ncbi:MAG: OsmC family protein, partial [Bacteroidota bacterium]